MQVLHRFFCSLAFGLTTAVILVAPWIFGAWEMWGFWPFAVVLFVAAICLGLCWVCGAAGRDGGGVPRDGICILAAFLPFLVYAFVRFQQADVYQDAERAFLLHATALLVGLIVVTRAGPRARRVLFLLIAADLFALGAYGLSNHWIGGNRTVMWVPGFPGYIAAHRATGSYFCPDHFSGIMEFAVCIGVALLLRGRGVTLRVAGGVLMGMGAMGVVLSKSRGGGLTLVVVALATLVWGFSHMPRATRNWWRLTACAVLLAGMILLAHFAEAYLERMGSYVGLKEARQKPMREAVVFVIDGFKQQDRALMFAGAVRAWRTHPWVGIGPGMHPNLWPHFGPTPDGDRAARRWPTRLNNDYVSNAVHNDWMQLLEEYGVIGFVLFLVPATLGWCALLRRVRDGARDRDGVDGAMPLAALLVVVAMAFHALGDFNLQMPATAWMFAALIALSFGTTTDYTDGTDSA